MLRWLNERERIPEQRLAAVGYGHVKPLVPPSRPGSQDVNKRVDIIVLSTLAEENHRLLDQVVLDRRPETTGPARHEPARHEPAATQAASHDKPEEH